MTLLLRHTDDIPRDAPVGGKAGALARLAPVVLPIPEWFVVLPAVFDASKAAETFRLRADLAAEIVETARVVAPAAKFFAVRSSALGEDGAEHSFAGQLDSFLFVPPECIPEKVEAVWRSGL